MSVDNSSVKGMDYSELLATDPDLYMIQWTEGKGEIERQDVANDLNYNGLREGFFDVTPYAGMFRQFLTRMKDKDLLLDQAKNVQIDLIKLLYDCKRQMPYHYVVAAGDYWWDASDATMLASTPATVQNTITKLNEVITRLNGLPPSINTGVIDRSNTSFSQISGGVNANVTEVNTAIAIFSNNADAANAGLLRTMLASIPVTDAAPITVNGAPGNPSNALNRSTNSESNLTITGIPSHLSWTPITSLATTNVQWIPIGETTPVNVTPAEQTAIMNGIAARTNALTLVKNSKSAEIMALTDIDDVIAYDVTAGWPDIPLPPGFDPNLYFSGNGGSVNFVGSTSGGGSGGVPEAPSDNVTYGRRNAVWNPALALSGDILDGGNF